MPQIDPAEIHRRRMESEPLYREVFLTAQAALAEPRSMAAAAKPRPGYETNPQPSKPGRENGGSKARRDLILII